MTRRPPTGADGWLPNEVETVGRARSGDAEAFGLLYDGCVDRVYRYIFFRVSDSETAEDLTSEVFLKAWQGMHRYRPEAPFIAWLFTIARNTVIDHYRTEKQNVSLETAEQSAVTWPNLHAGLELEDQMGLLSTALRSLTEEQRLVLELKFIAGMETAEIARRLRKREGAIRALQMRGLQSLARAMGDEVEPSE